MNWLVFAVATYLLLALDVGASKLVSIGGVQPQWLLVLLVFVGLMAPTQTAAIAALVIGVILDLLPGPVPGATIIGPYAIGCLVGMYAVLQLRGLVLRESVVTLTATVFVVGLLTELVVVAAFSFRQLPWPLGEPIAGWSAAGQLAGRFLDVVYTTVVAVPLGVVLRRTRSLWRMPMQK